MIRKILLAVVLFLSISQKSTALEPAQAEAFMAEIGNDVIRILTDRMLTPGDRHERFKTILETKFNLRAIGKFVLGRYWKNASEDQKKRFLDLFTASTVASYAKRFQDYTSERFDVMGSHGERDGGVTVLTRIARPNGQDILINWKIFEKNGVLQVYDVVLEGISMGITQRSEFATVIQKGGGTLDALIKALEAKTRETTQTK